MCKFKTKLYNFYLTSTNNILFYSLIGQFAGTACIHRKENLVNNLLMYDVIGQFSVTACIHRKENHVSNLLFYSLLGQFPVTACLNRRKSYCKQFTLLQSNCAVSCYCLHQQKIKYSKKESYILNC